MKNKSFIAVVGLFILLFLICACKNKEEFNNPEDFIELTIKDVEDGCFAPSEQWEVSDKKICVFFGYGYNEESFTSQMLEKLSVQFGLAQDGGLIYPLIFPKDFKIAGKERISHLADLLESYELKGLILIGAPENTHNAISSYMSTYGDVSDGWKLPFPVFSMFSQDNPLGTEWISDFVLEKMHVSDILSEEEQTETASPESQDLIIRAIKYMNLLDSPLNRDSDLIIHVQRIAGNGKKVSRYVDSDSGLRPVNHFVFRDE